MMKIINKYCQSRFKRQEKIDKKIFENTVKSIETNPDTIIATLTQKKYLHIYHSLLKYVLQKADIFFHSPLSWFAFERHFILSLVYSLLFFLIAYVFTGANTISGLAIMSEEAAWYIRLLWLLGLVVLGVGSFLYFYNLEKITQILIRHTPFLEKYQGSAFLENVLYIVVGAVGAEVVNAAPAVIYLLYFALFPFINAMLDFLSTALSRYLGEKLLTDLSAKKVWVVVARSFIDIVFAFCAFVVLGLGIYMMIALASFYLDVIDAQDVVLDANAILNSWLHDPWSEYLWITFMLISTFVPTFVHLSIVVASLVSWVFFEKPKMEIIELIHSKLYAIATQKYLILMSRSKKMMWGFFVLVLLGVIYFGDFLSWDYSLLDILKR